MPGEVHETVTELLTRPGVPPQAIRVVFKRKAPSFQPSDPNFAEVNVLERRNDGFFLAGPPKSPSNWLILEVQVSIDPAKYESVPLTYAMASSRYPGVPGDVLLVTVGKRVARYFARHPFVRSGVLGTQEILRVVRLDLARIPPSVLLTRKYPDLAPLAVAAAKGRRDEEAVARRAIAITARLRQPWKSMHGDAILHMLNAAMRRRIEGRMQREGYRTDWLQESYLKGTTDGAVKNARLSLKKVLATRGFVLNPSLERRIDAESDVKTLQRWLTAAVKARSASAALADSRVRH